MHMQASPVVDLDTMPLFVNFRQRPPFDAGRILHHKMYQCFLHLQEEGEESAERSEREWTVHVMDESGLFMS